MASRTGTPASTRPKARAQQPFDDARVKAVFDTYPAEARRDLLHLRALIFETASELKQVGRLIETLKWGQPAYLPAKPRIGSTIRIDTLGDRQEGYAIYFHCQTTLVATFRQLYPELLEFEGNRAVLLSRGEKAPHDALKHCIGLALTYHVKARRSADAATP